MERPDKTSRPGTCVAGTADDSVKLWIRVAAFPSPFDMPQCSNIYGMSCGGTLHFFMQDGLGSVRNIISQAQVTENSYGYTAFGEALTTTEAVQNRYRYTGREFEECIKIFYYRNRYYDHNGGRFTSRDSIEHTNHYSYALNNPLLYLDPMGQDENTTDSQCSCGPNVTEWFTKEINAHTSFFKQYQYMDGPSRLIFFANYAKNMGYKYLKFGKYGIFNEDEKCGNTVTLCDSCIHVSELGGIMFGAIGRTFLGSQRTVIHGGIYAGNKSSTGGLDSVADFAGAIGGLLLGDSIRNQNRPEGTPPEYAQITSQSLCDNLKRNPTELIKFLKGTLNEKYRLMLDNIGDSPLAAMAQSYSECKSCSWSIPDSTPNSNFSIFPTANWPQIVNAKNFWLIYTGLKSNNIDVGGVPSSK